MAASVVDYGVRLADDILHRWRRMGSVRKFRTDTEIASFLLDQFESSPNGGTSCCIHCHGPLTLCCVSCQLPVLSTFRNTLDTTLHPKVDASDINPSAHKHHEQMENESRSELALSYEGSASFGEKLSSSQQDEKLDACDETLVRALVTETTLNEDETTQRGRDVDKIDGPSIQNSGNEKLLTLPESECFSDSETVVSGQNKINLEVEPELQEDKVPRKCQKVWQSSFKTHSQTTKRPFTCNECDKAFALSSLLRQHKHTRSHTDGSSKSVMDSGFKKHTRRRRKTERKGSQSNSFSSTKSHVLSRKGKTGVKAKKSPRVGENAHCMKDRSVYCDECGAKSADPSSLKVHMRIHRDDRPYVCCDCGVGFRQSCHLINHRRIHTGEKPFKCHECDTAFRRAEELRTHMFKHTGNTPYVCSICGMQSASASCLKVHMRIHNDEKRFVCDDCGAAFRQSGQLIQHRRRAHTGEKPYRCQQCDSAFATSGALKVHMVKHTGERRYMCEECGAKFPYSSSLKVHMRTHTTDRPFVCSQCGAAFNQPAILSRHLKTHSSERPYMCTVCGSSFAHRPYLKDHMRFHTNERPYACTECNARFHMSCTLKTHMRTHSGEKPFVCNECGSSFAESKNLRAHIKTHSGEKPHQCPQCGSRFTVAGSLKIHMRKHTGEKPYVCAQCAMAFALSRDLKKHVQSCSVTRLEKALTVTQD